MCEIVVVRSTTTVVLQSRQRAGGRRQGRWLAGRTKKNSLPPPAATFLLPPFQDDIPRRSRMAVVLTTFIYRVFYFKFEHRRLHGYTICTSTQSDRLYVSRVPTRPLTIARYNSVVAAS